MSKTIRKYWRRETIAFTLLGCLAIALFPLAFTQSSTAAGPKKKVDTPILSAVQVAPTSIDVQVCAPDNGTNPTGLPAGFSIQWMTKADFDAFGGWPSDSSTGPASFCKASFSGNAFNSRYDLLPGECVTVRIGDILTDNGASTGCPDPLECDTAYVFRAFGHATSSLNRSDFTPDLNAKTTPCNEPDEDGCTLTQGYWKTHGPSTCVKGNNINTWPVSSLSLGNVSYTDVELCSIFQKSVGSNGLIALAHQLIAAKLNVANGADDTDVAASITAADTMIGNLVVPPVGSGSLSANATSALVTALDSYNSGLSGPGHCK